MKVSTDPKDIAEVLDRSVATIYPNKDALQKKLESGEQLRIYMGIDPTADYIHIGHSINYLKLDRLHKMGHKIFVLVGDFTATIGDPDKTSLRKPLTQEEVQENLSNYKEQIGKILDFENKENPIEFVFNSEWLSKLNFADVIDLASNFTVQQMLERDMFEKRIKEQSPLYVHEFFYPLMQGYDSVHMNIDLEIGGSDQTFNMLAGRTLVKRYQDREKFVLTINLLENPDTGKKFGKSDGTGIPLNASPDEMFKEAMKLPDSAIEAVFQNCTRLSFDEVADKRASLDPRSFKLELAQELVRMYHDEAQAKKAHEDWIAIFSQGEAPDEIPSFEVAYGMMLTEALTVSGHAPSKGAARRLIEQNAIAHLGGGEKITDPRFTIDEEISLRVKKHEFVKFTTS